MTYILVYNKKKNLKQASQRNDKQYKCWDFELRKFPPPPFSSLWRGHQYILTGEHFITEVQLLLIIPYIIQPHSHYFQFPTRPLSSLAHLSVSVCMSTCLCLSVCLPVCVGLSSCLYVCLDIQQLQSGLELRAGASFSCLCIRLRASPYWMPEPIRSGSSSPGKHKR